MAPNTLYARWRYALKPASWPKLFIPAVFGQALGAAHLGRVDLAPAAAGMVFTFLLLAFVVLMNDFADREVDALKRRSYPNSGAPKTIPDGILSAHQVLFGGLGAGALALAFAAYSGAWLNRPGFGIAGAVALLTFAAYSLPPLKLNYRGRGELLEMLGVGFLLPWINAYAQGGLGAESLAWVPRAWPLLIGFSFLTLSSAIASGLSDEVTDRRGGKRTFTTQYGNAMARGTLELLLPVGVLAWGLTGLFSPHVPLVTVLPASLWVLYHWWRLQALSDDAITNAFEAQARYKGVLHRGIWRGAELLGGALIVHRLFFSA